ncbi:MAG: hypothetical protein M1828_005066 [Chrysothrix sp. TS-e1954]|nr:MAG: hypothetical protein M1828_005066 [Chrysothrix sp. TS-e1954]
MNPLIPSDINMPGPDPVSVFDEKSDDVAMIHPDDDVVEPSVERIDEDSPQPTRADDFEAMKREYFKELPDLETVAETTDTWPIRDWNRLPKREHGPTFDCGGDPWRVLFFPFGNSQPEYVSFYLEHGYGDKPPENWYACVQFMLVLWNPNDPTVQSRHHAQHRFNADESDWGFTKFCELRNLVQAHNKEGRPLVEDEAANMTAYVRVVKDPTGVLWHNFVNYDSKKETGMVGLRNQGATCYLNSLLQSLYFTDAFRKAIYQIPTENEHDVRENSAWALQRLYYMLQTSNDAVSTNELTTSFGWESRQIFEQQDVQELSRILMDKMEERMKGTPAEKALPNMLVGQMKTYIACINVDYESSRPEDFWDIQLNVRGNKTLDDSFKDYIQVETMDGDNKYFAEGHGLQDAKKGVIFEKFPEVLHLQLKRFEYNFQADAMTKVYDQYDFPEVWDASPYLSETADKSEPYIYHLHGVLVHSGDLNAGHYYAFLKPTRNGDFYRFDDDRVTRATKKEAMDENFGGDFAAQPNGVTAQRNPYTRTLSRQRFMSAYMLVYIRESRMDHVLQPIGDADVPKHLGEKIEAERAEAERRRKDKEEAHLYMQVVVGTESSFKEHQGFDIYPTTAAAVRAEHPSAPKPYRVLKSMSVKDLNAMIARDLNVEPETIRCWGMVGRQNATTRPDSPLVWDDLSVEEAMHKLQAKVPFKLWVEPAVTDEEGKPSFPSYTTLMDNRTSTAPILLFLKHFDIENQTLKGAGHLYVDKSRRVPELAPMIIDRMAWPTDTKMKLYEEIKQRMIEPLNSKNTLAASELQHGDIVCFQKVLDEEQTVAAEKAQKYTDAKNFYDYLHHRCTITLTNKLNTEEDFRLELSKIFTYDQVAAKVGAHLAVDPTHLRFSTVNSSNNKPRGYVKPNANQSLYQIFTPQYGTYGAVSSQRSDWLYYEVLDIPLSELETKKLMKINLLSEGITKEDIVEILVPKNGTVSDVYPALQKKANLSDDYMENLRLYEVHSGRIYKELSSDVPVQTFNEWVTIYGEQLPQEEQDADLASDRAVYAFNYDKEPTKYFGIPFKFLVKRDEKFSDTRERLSKRTGFKGKQLEKIKFAVVSRGVMSRPQYLQDDDILDDMLKYNEDQLGLDHVNKQKNIWSKSDVMMIRVGSGKLLWKSIMMALL